MQLCNFSCQLTDARPFCWCLWPAGLSLQHVSAELRRDKELVLVSLQDWHLWIDDAVVNSCKDRGYGIRISAERSNAQDARERAASFPAHRMIESHSSFSRLHWCPAAFRATRLSFSLSLSLSPFLYFSACFTLAVAAPFSVGLRPQSPTVGAH